MANLFAQISSANWDATNQWNTVANGSGSFVTPGPGDVCMLNGKNNININVDVTVSQIRNDTTGGATIGGTVTISGSVTITANITLPPSYSFGVITTNSPGVVNVIGSCTGGSWSANLFNFTGTGTLNITGDLRPISGFSIYVNGSGTLNTNGTLDLTGQTGGCINASNASSARISAVGNAFGGSTVGSYGAILNQAASLVDYTGIPSATSAGHCVIHLGSGTTVITDSSEIVGQNGSTGLAVSCTGTGLVTINADVTGGNTAPAILGTGGNIVINGTLKSGSGSSGFPAVYYNGLLGYSCIAESVSFSDQNYRAPFSGNVLLKSPVQTGLEWRINQTSGPPVRLYESSILMADMPVPADVRYGTTYQQGGQVGTCHIPPAASVGVGVPVDATVGTAAVTAAAIRDAVGLSAANLDTQLGKLGSPVALDGGSATLSGMLAKLADDSGGEDYDATTDSLRTKTGTSAQQVWEYATRTITAGGLSEEQAQAAALAALAAYGAALETTATAIKAVADKTDTMLEVGGDDYRYTATALAQAPAPSVPSAADIADAVCDEVLDGHAAEGTVGAALTAAGASADPMALPMGDYPEGSAGYEIHDLYERITEALPDYPAIVVPAPPTTEQTTAWIRCLDEHGAPEGGVTIQVRLVRVDEGADAYDMGTIEAVSAAQTGLATAVIPRGAQYIFEARRGPAGRWMRFRGASAPTLLLPPVLGQ